MSGMFDIDSPIMNVLNKVMNIVIVNLCFILSCLPIITVGAAITAMYSVNLKMAHDEETYVFTFYWKAFRRNFAQSTICWLFVVTAGAVLGIDFWFIGNTMTGVIKNVFYAVIIVSTVVYGIILIYVFPYIARFENKLLICIKNSLIIGGANIGYTVTMLLVTLASLALTFFSPQVFFRALFVWIVAGFSLLSFINSFFLRRVFAKYE